MAEEKSVETVAVPASLKNMAAVQIIDGRFVFGKENFGVKKANLTLSKGAIYALLGPSGCGKTTLLSSVVGIRKLQSGTVFVFGRPPHSKEAGVPGPSLGYMPQETCLCAELTTEESLQYFGLLHRLSRKELRQRTEFLKGLLELPSGQMAGTMSGGQKRRLSLAVAMVHDPPLLILDEPTVGVDPLLRTVIWKHLLDLTNDHGKTVLITTHYIQEASAAHLVGFMRDGCVLEEATPEEVLRKHQADTLEEAFLKLCLSVELDKSQRKELDYRFSVAQSPVSFSKFSKTLKRDVPRETQWEFTLEKYKRRRSLPCQRLPSTSSPKSSPGVSNPVFVSDSERSEALDISSRKEMCDENQEKQHRNGNRSALPETSSIMPNVSGFWTSALTNTYAVAWKNSLIIRRNIVLLVITFLTPINNLVMVKFLIGKTPHDIPVGVVNDDVPSTMSDLLIRTLDNRTFDLKFYETLEEARRRQSESTLQAVIHIRPEFSLSLIRRAQQRLNADNSTIEKTFIRLYMDWSNLELGRTIYSSLLESYARFVEEAVSILGVDKEATRSALRFESPVVGPEKPELSEYLTVNMLPDSLFIMGLAFTVLVFVENIASGVHDREYVSGVKNFQMILSHWIIHTTVTTVQIGILVAFMTLFRYGILGNYYLICLLLYQASYLGMALGVLLVSLNCKVSNAVLAVITVYWFSCSLSGLMWPPESHPPGIRLISELYPCTSIYQSVRLVAHKGLGLNHPFIWQSIVKTLSWTLGLLLVACFLLQRNKPRLFTKMFTLFRKN